MNRDSMIDKLAQYATKRVKAAEVAAAPTKKVDDDKGQMSPKIANHRDIFNLRCFKGGGKANQAGDGIGLMWLLGKLDAPDLDDTRLLDAARAWWHGRSVYFREAGYKTSRHDRSSRTSSSAGKIMKAERDFKYYASMLLDADERDRDCLEELMNTSLDGDCPNWVSRIVQTELLKIVRFPGTALARQYDYDRLEGAIRALRAMAGADAIKRAA